VFERIPAPVIDKLNFRRNSLQNTILDLYAMISPGL